MLESLKRLRMMYRASDRELLQRRNDRTDRAIDRLVYELCDPTEGEIAIVEGKE